VRIQELRGQGDEFRLAPDVLQRPVKANVVGGKVLPRVLMRVKSRVVALDRVTCV
jgi:hypothetical protein